MTRRRDISSILIPAAIFIFLEVAAVSMLSSNSSAHDSWFRAASFRMSCRVWQGKMKKLAKKNLQARYDSLLVENLLLQQKLLSMSEAGFTTSDSTYTYTEATVVKLSTNSQRGTIVLDKGRLDGVENGSGIITPHGVVGIVDVVFDHFCHGITFQHPNISVSARVGESGVAAPLVWDGISQSSAIFQGVPAGYPVNDTLYTSGFSAIYPPHIPLGVPVRIKNTNGAAYDYEVRLFQDFSLLHKVSIVGHRYRDEL